jgi:transglutaminase-like putative cysteine protease
MPLRSFTRAELILTERRRLERPLLLLILLSVTAFSLAEGNLFYLFAGLFAVTVNMLATHWSKEVFVERIFVNIGVLVATAILILEIFFGGVASLIALGHYMVLIQLCKLFERKRNRDYVQMLLLSLLLMVAAGVISDSLPLAVLVVAYIALACYTAMVFTLKRGLDAVAEARLRTESGPLAPDRVAWNVVRDWPGGAIRRALAIAFLAIALAGAAMFLAAPRLSLGGQQSLRPSQTDAWTGVGTGITLGHKQHVYESDRVVMYVRFGDGLPPRRLPVSALYLKGRAFNRYDGSKWLKQPHVRHAGGLAPPPPPEARRSEIRQAVRMRSSLLPTVFATYPAPRAASAEGSCRIQRDLEISLAPRGRTGGFVTYTAYFWPQPLTAAQRRYLREVHAADAWLGRRPSEWAPAPATARVRQLAEQWCADLIRPRAAEGGPRDRQDLAIADRIAQRLAERCRYSLAFEDADPTRDAVEDFLFRLRRGHCEYFASALAVMCRALGVRARVATGFRLGEFDDGRGRFIVRERNAHAWVEVFAPSTDWVIRDATPPGALAAARGSWWQRLNAWWEQMRLWWYEKVVSYDEQSRQHLSRRIAGWFQWVSRAIRERAALVLRNVARFFSGQQANAILAIGTLVVAVALPVLAVWVIRRLPRGRGRRREAPVPRPEFFAKLLSLLARKGLRAAPSQTPRELAAAAAETLHLPPDSMQELIALYYRIRWAGRDAAAEELAAADRRVQRLARSLAT